MYDVILYGKKVIGAKFATPYGTVEVTAKATIDATGDGDVAAMAGAKYISC